MTIESVSCRGNAIAARDDVTEAEAQTAGLVSRSTEQK